MSRRRPDLIIALLLLALFSAIPAGARAQREAIQATYQSRFGERITFLGKLPPQLFVQEVQLHIRVEGEPLTRNVAPKHVGLSIYRYDLDLRNQPIRAFSEVEFWFTAVLEADGKQDSPKTVFIYADDRFDWQTEQNPLFRAHWYATQGPLGQDLLSVAEAGLQKAQSLLPLGMQAQVDIYTYASAEEMRSALQIAGRSWVGAHTDPDLGVMTLSLPPGAEQRLEMERQIPHELMHILLFQHLGPAYRDLPVWFNEGLASTAELYPNPDYLIILRSAYQKGSLVPIASLCDAFPRDASGAYLAYAEAASFTTYLQRQYGTEGLTKLLNAYANGMDCERGVETALETTLVQLERGWQRQAFNDSGLQDAALNFAPYGLLMLLLVIIPLSLAFRRPRRARATSAGPRSEKT